MADQAARVAALSLDKRAVLTRRLAAMARASSGPVALPRHGGVQTFPTSHAQERLWFLHQVAPASAAYNLTGAFQVTGGLDVPALCATFDALVARHESLRTTFVAVEGRPVQVVAPWAHVATTITELSPDTPAADMRVLLTDAAVRPFDVAHGPLLRLRVFVLGAATHLVAVTMHHLIADAWSVTVLVRELGTLYREIACNGARANKTRLLAPRLQYPDYAVWQRARYVGARGDALVSYWRRQLAAAPYPEVAVAERLHGRGAAERTCLSRGLAAALRDCAQRQGVTLFVLTLAAWKTTLMRRTGCHDVTVLVPVANRERSEVAETLGFFVNVLALRTCLDGAPSFREVVARVNRVVREALQHQELPFEMVLHALGVDRTLMRPPLSPFAFALEPQPPATIDLGGVEAVAVPVDTTTSRTDLALIVSERADGLAVRLEYDSELHAASVAAALLREYIDDLERVANDGELRRARVSPSPAPRSPAALGPVTVGDDPTTVWSRFMAQARATPASTAIRAGGEVVTYRELAVGAGEVAARLAVEGVARGAVVAVWGDRRASWLRAMLGIWAHGAVYVPVEPRWPAARVLDVLTRSGAVALLADETRCASLPMLTAGARRVICVGDSVGDAYALVGDPRGSAPHEVAYVIYTSGSTGKPKGALIEHAGLLNHLEAKIALLGITAQDRVAQTAAAGFDVSLWQGLAPLLAGATVEILDDEVARDPIALRGAIRERCITVVELVPAVLQLVLEANAAHELSDAMGSLRWLVVTGEALPPELCRRWLACCPHVPLVNAYGPTECADDVTHFVVHTPPATDEVRVPIGWPIPGMTVHVLDAHLVPVADGDAGELCVAGLGVGRGYLGDADRTAASFVTPDPFVKREGTRLYRTGDRGRRRADGAFEWLGRLDAQAKIRGVRIEPAEVEAVICTHPAVRQAAVLAIPSDEPSRLVAFVVVREIADRGALRRHVAERLPDAMVPAAFVELPALPLTSNGKVDREALARRRLAEDDTSPTGPQPTTLTERLLAELWEQVLGRPARSVDEGFFALGGDSLSSIRLVASARRHGLVFTPQQVFEHQTIAALAGVARSSTRPLCEQDVVVGDVALTPIQRMLLSADLPDVAHYNMSMLLAAEERLRPECLAVAVEHVLRHHDVLRLRVRRDGAQWRGAIAGLDGAVPYDHHDLSVLADAEAASAIEATAGGLQATLDLTAGPIVRVASFDLGPHRPSRLLVVVHHLACDAASWPILLEDLIAVYAQVRDRVSISLPDKTTSYRTWARLLAERDASDELAFWRRECADPGSRLRRARAPEVASIADLASLWVGLTVEETRRVQVRTAALGVTVETVLLAALATVLTEPEAAETLLVFLERHGRAPLWPDVDVSRTVGWFTAVFPVCVPVAPSRRPRETLALVDEHLRQIPNGGIGWGLLGFGSVASPDALRGGARPAVSCNYLGRIDPPLGSGWSIAPESAGGEIGRRGTRPTALDVVAHLAGERLHVAWHYDGGRHCRGTMAAFADRLLDVLRELARGDVTP